MSPKFKPDYRSDYERIKSGIMELDDDHRDFMEDEQYRDRREENEQYY